MSSQNTFQHAQIVYSRSGGIASTGGNLVMTRNPNTYDVSYVIGQFWQNTQNTSIWYLNSQTSANGLLQSNWVAIASTLNSISDTVNTPVYPSSGLSIPPDNIQLVGASGISVVSNAVANLLTISATGTIGQTITGNTGGPLIPTLGNWNILGDGSITSIGLGSTLTVQLTGLNNHAVLLGAGTSTITSLGPTATVGQVLQSAGPSADPAFSTATYPLTTTVNQLLYSSATDTVTGLATANRAVLTTNATGVPALTALATDGQLIIGSTAGAPAAATLTAGSGIVVTNASNSITIAANGFALAYTNVTFAMSPYTVLSTDYYISVNSSGGAVTLRFPNAPTVNQTWTVKDRTGNASANNISVTTVGGAVTIDGATTYTIISNYGSINLINNATSYEVY